MALLIAWVSSCKILWRKLFVRHGESATRAVAAGDEVDGGFRSRHWRIREIERGFARFPNTTTFSPMGDLLSPDVNDLDDRLEVRTLFANLKVAMPELKASLENCSGHWAYEDCVYRFYHHSFKVYGLQNHTISIVEKLGSLRPDRELNQWFRELIASGTGKVFSSEHNEKWRDVTRPILEAFFHARYFLEMAVKYGHCLEYPPRSMPSGWAALLYLYGVLPRLKGVQA